MIDKAKNMKKNKHKKNISILILTCFLILLSLNFISSASNNNNVINHDINLVAGSSKCIQDKLANNEDHPVNITDFNHMITNEKGDTIFEGITITVHEAIPANSGYNKGDLLELPVTIPGQETFNFYICYSTDIRLKPDIYTMKTSFVMETEPEEEEDIVTVGTIGGGNIPPTADADGPYFEIKEISIDFNASKSYDPDGEIRSYRWNLGEGNTSNKMTVSHAYNEPGNYTVTLVVTDNGGKTNTDTTYALIAPTPNIPPSIPEIDGKTILKTNKNYTFSAYSYNNDNDSLKYNFSWDDKTYNKTDFVDNGTIVEKNHSWNTKGIYDIKVTVTDENNATSSNTLTVYIDVIEFIKNDIEGYLLDENADGIYDLFHNNKTGNRTYLEFIDIGYKIDIDDDGDWDYNYNTTTKTIQDIKKETKEETNILYYILGPIIVALIFIAIIILFFKKSE